MTTIPRWLRWLVSPDPRPERGGPRNPDLPRVEMSDEEVEAAIERFADQITRALYPIDMVRLRAFVEALPPVTYPTTTWPLGRKEGR